MFEFALAIKGLLMFSVNIYRLHLQMPCCKSGHMKTYKETSWIFAGMHFARFNSQPSCPH